MKKLLLPSVVVVLLLGAMLLAHHQQVTARPGAGALLAAAADAQHEATRLPARMDTLSDEQEIEIGSDMASRYATGKLDAKQLATERYLQRVGEHVAAGARRKLPYKFHYLPDEHFVNAFALPGGQVFVGEGLLRLMKSEDALAAVLGHEVEHVDLRHCAERVQVEARLRQIDVLGPVSALAGLPVELFVAGYSKEQETEADRDGVALAVKAGYSPEGILALMGEFQKLEGEADGAPNSPAGEAARLTLASLSGYFASHPPAAERAAAIRALVAENGWPSPKLRPLVLPK